MKVQEEKEIQGLKDIVSNSLEAKFQILNNDKFIEFKQLLEKDCKKLARVLKQHNFEPIFDKKINQFYKEFESDNMKIYDVVQSKYI